MNKNWTNKEIEFLKTHYKTLGGEICAFNLNKTPSSIYSKARRYNLQYIAKHFAWTSEKEDWLKENYYKGAKFCADYFNTNSRIIEGRAKKLKLRLTPEEKSDLRCTFDINHWTNLNNAEIVYLLGYFWADGGASKKNFTFKIVKKDFEDIEYIFKSGLGWNFYTHQPSNGKLAAIAETGSIRYTNFLKENDYFVKSQVSANKILSKIPENLKHYWFRGFFDGDGCFFNGKSNRFFAFTGGYNQDWKFIINLLNNLKIKFSIKKEIKKLGRSSTIVCQNYEGIQKLGNYIYQGQQFGLKRKLDKFEIIIEKYKKFSAS